MQILIPGLFLTFCFYLGSFPLTNLIVKNLANIDLKKVGTGNVSVAAAFVSAPKPVAIFAVLAEISRGIAPVLAAKLLFPEIASWQLVGLIFLVAGRYFIAEGGGVTNASWGVLVYSPLVALASGITGFSILVIGKQVLTRKNRNIRQWSARLGCLSSFLWVLLFRQEPSFYELLATAGLVIFLVVINFRQSDDMALQKQPQLSLDNQLNPKICGEKAARLALLKKAGFNVPDGFVLPAIEKRNRELVVEGGVKKSVVDSRMATGFFSTDKILDKLNEMSWSFPLIVRSSAVGEDSDNSSAAGQYETIFPVRNETELLEAINICRQSYWLPDAVAYRRQREIPDAEMAVLIQPYIISKVAGVMFTRNPLDGGGKIIIEALPGGAEKVVGGQLTPVHLEIDKNRFHESQNSTVKGKSYDSVDKSFGLENQEVLSPEIYPELVNEGEGKVKGESYDSVDKSFCLETQEILPPEIIPESFALETQEILPQKIIQESVNEGEGKVKGKSYDSVDESFGLETQEILPQKIIQESVNEGEGKVKGKSYDSVDNSFGLETQEVLPQKIIPESFGLESQEILLPKIIQESVNEGEGKVKGESYDSVDNSFGLETQEILPPEITKKLVNEGEGKVKGESYDSVDNYFGLETQEILPPEITKKLVNEGEAKVKGKSEASIDESFGLESQEILLPKIIQESVNEGEGKVKGKSYDSVDNSFGLESQEILPPEIYPELVNEGEAKVKGKSEASIDKSFGLENQEILPLEIIQELVNQAEAIEGFFHGLPQDIEWCWDGEKIWILQSRPITNLRPIWTRTIAAEVIPGAIHPLTWSINRPLTCGVWGEIFTIVLGEKVTNLDFTETATLLGSHAYFNATLLGEIFRMMGLPEQGLEFLLRGQKMGKPPLGKVWSALPGLWRLIQKEMAVDRDFERDYNQIFVPALESLENNFKQISSQSLSELLAQAERIQEWLKPITFYNILGPIGLAIRRSLFAVSEEWLPTDTAPEIVSIRELQRLAVKLKMATNSDVEIEAKFEENQELQREFQQWLKSYGYLSEVGTDIAVATWGEKPDNFRELLLAMARKGEREKESFKENFSVGSLNLWQRWRLEQCAKRARTKGKIAEVYGKLLAYLRLTFLAMEIKFKSQKSKFKSDDRQENLEVFQEKGDIFYLEFEEIRQWILSKEKSQEASVEKSPLLPYSLTPLLRQRKEQLEKDSDRQVPQVVYGNVLPQESQETFSTEENVSILQGIPGSVGCVEGYVKVCRSLEVNLAESENLIIVVPYTDAGWAPLLLKAKGIIAEVGGQLSHGAIIAREYGIPAVMNVSGAMTRLQDGQKVRVDGYRGTVQLL